MSALTILRDDAVALCVALGFKTAASWNKQRMSKKMADLAEMVEDGAIEVEDDADDAERLNELLLQIGEAKGDVNVVQELSTEEAEEAEDTEDDLTDEQENDSEDEDESEEDAEDEDATPPSKAEKPAKKQPKAKKPADKTATRTRNLDCFGSREGTQASSINKVLSKQGVTLDDICKATGLPLPRVKQHVAGLVRKGKAKKNNNMFSIV